jgi:hypothetical protein
MKYGYIQLVLPFLFFYLALAPSTHSQELEINEIRNRFFDITVNSESAPALFQDLQKSSTPNKPILIAYLGATQAILTRHKWDPFSKIQLLRASLENLNHAVLLEPQNIEIRFLRYCVETHVPGIPGLSRNLKSDKLFLVNNCKLFDSRAMGEQMRKYILSFINSDQELSARQKKVLSDSLIN